MALSQAAALMEEAVGPKDNATTEQNVSNPNRNVERYADPSGARMKALVWNGKNSVKLVDTNKPAIIEQKDVIVKVTGTTICGSDLHLYHASVIELEKGDILGHEFCGVVESVGAEVTKLRPGQRVVCSFQIACGQCMYCQQKLSSQCERTNESTIENAMYGGRTAAMLGYSHFTGGFAGGQAEFVRVPFGDVNLLPLPDNVPDEAGLYLSDVLCTSWHCVVDTGVKKGDVVAIWGAGPIGQMCVDFSFFHGADRVILIDGGSGAWRLDFVQSIFPKVETIDFTKLPKGETIVTTLKGMVHSGPDIALECVAGEYAKGWAHSLELSLGLETDTSEIVNEMMMSVKSFGRCGITGVYVGYTNHFNIGCLMERGIRLFGNGQAPVHKYWVELLQYIQEGKIHPYNMLTHRFLIDDMETIYKKYNERADGIQKIFVATAASFPPAPNTPTLTRLN